MFWTKRVVIGDGERGLVYRNRRFERLLAPGVYRWFDPMGRTEVRTFNIASPEYAGHDVDALTARLGDRLGEVFLLADIGVDQVGLVLKNGKLEDVLPPGTRRLYWIGLVKVEVQPVSLAKVEVDVAVARRLRQLGALSKLAVVAEVPAEFAGLVFFDGKLERTLAPGSYAFWNFQKNVVVDVVDLRVQSIEVSGQELLTRDKVSLRVNLLGLQQKRKDLESRFTAQHPSMQALDAQIKDITAQISSLDGKSKTFPNVEQDLLRLTRDVKVNNDLYTGLLNSFQQLRLVKEGKVGNVRIVDVAAVPEQPIKPERSRIVSIAAVLGLLAGLGLAYLRNSLRPGIKTADDIEQHLGLHVFATVPHSPAQVVQAQNVKAKTAGTHLLAVLEPQDPAVESLRSLRTALQFAMLDAPNNIVLITGPTPGIGKSFTSANFAAVLGAANKRVLLIDADLRKGHLNQYFGLHRSKGLSEVIAGTLTLQDALHKQVAPMVDFLSTGTMPPNPAEVLMTPTTQALLQQLSALYDLVIIDTPPVLAASDTAILAPLAGAVFMVARAEVTSLSELQESAKRLLQSGVPTRGVIFNGLNLSKRRYGYGMGYKYGRYRYTNYQY